MCRRSWYVSRLRPVQHVGHLQYRAHGRQFQAGLYSQHGVPDHVAINYLSSYCYDEVYGGVASDEVSGVTAYSVPINQALAINGVSIAIPGTSGSYAENEQYLVSRTQTDADTYNDPGLFPNHLRSPSDVPFTIESVTPDVPEPSTWAMMILGFAGVGLMAYRRKKQGARMCS